MKLLLKRVDVDIAKFKSNNCTYVEVTDISFVLGRGAVSLDIAGINIY